MKWEPSPETELLSIERKTPGGWDVVSFDDLHVGDVVRFFATDGRPFNPGTCEVLDAPLDLVVCGAPFKNMETGRGYLVEVAMPGLTQ